MSPQRPDQHPIILGRVESRIDQVSGDKSDDQASLQLEYYEPTLRQMMKRMGYDLTLEQGLNFGKWRKNLLRSFVLKGKNLNYYHKARRGLAYIVPSTSLEAELK